MSEADNPIARLAAIVGDTRPMRAPVQLVERNPAPAPIAPPPDRIISFYTPDLDRAKRLMASFSHLEENGWEDRAFVAETNMYNFLERMAHVHHGTPHQLEAMVVELQGSSIDTALLSAVQDIFRHALGGSRNCEVGEDLGHITPLLLPKLVLMHEDPSQIPSDYMLGIYGEGDIPFDEPLLHMPFPRSIECTNFPYLIDSTAQVRELVLDHSQEKRRLVTLFDELMLEERLERAARSHALSEITSDPGTLDHELELRMRSGMSPDVVKERARRAIDIAYQYQQLMREGLDTVSLLDRYRMFLHAVPSIERSAPLMQLTKLHYWAEFVATGRQDTRAAYAMAQNSLQQRAFDPRGEIHPLDRLRFIAETYHTVQRQLLEAAPPIEEFSDPAANIYRTTSGIKLDNLIRATYQRLGLK